MKIITLLAVFTAVILTDKVSKADSAGKVICYYDSSSFVREGLGKLVLNDLEPALSFCTHLVYGYSGLNAETNKLISLKESLDLDQGKGHYRVITNLKRKYPQLKVLLSIGGNVDLETPEKYMTMLESSGGRIAFINSAHAMLKTYDFDGLDLAWQFPPNKPKKIRGAVKSVFHKLKKIFGGGNTPVDEKADEHREEFTALVRELKNSFRHEGFLLSLTVLPNVNSTMFYDIPAIINYLDFVNLAAFDFQTPDRNPKEADYPAPIYELNERNPNSNINAQVQLWLSNRCPASKINVGIPTFGRVWKMTEDSGITGVPPIPETENEVAPGPQTGISGLYSWPETCAKLLNPNNAHLKGEDAPFRKVGDPTKRFGTYAYRVPDESGEHGLWVGYEDPDTAGNKAAYVRAKGLGGIAIFDLSYDDFRGTCSGDKFPILRAAKYRL